MGTFSRYAIFSSSLLTLLVSSTIGAGRAPRYQDTAATKVIAESDCTAARLGNSVPIAAIGEPVASVTSRPINFRVVLPATWTRHAAQLGGGGSNGNIPNLTGNGDGPLLARGFATYGSDSLHQIAGPTDWTLNDEAIKNLGYMQMKKTHDAAMVLIERMYGSRPAFNYFIGTSQRGLEALTVAQRYFADYNGIAANVPFLSFSSLMLAPELIRIQEKSLANWITPAKVNAICTEFVRQCDKLDGLADGIMNN